MAWGSACLELVLEGVDMVLPASGVLSTQPLSQATPITYLLRHRRVGPQVVVDDGAVGKWFEPYLAATDQGACDGPTDAPVAPVHEDRQLEFRPPGSPHVGVVDSCGEDCWLADDEGLVDQIHQWHIRQDAINSPRRLALVRQTASSSRRREGMRCRRSWTFEA